MSNSISLGSRETPKAALRLPQSRASRLKNRLGHQAREDFQHFRARTYEVHGAYCLLKCNETLLWEQLTECDKYTHTRAQIQRGVHSHIWECNALGSWRWRMSLGSWVVWVMPCSQLGFNWAQCNFKARTMTSRCAACVACVACNNNNRGGARQAFSTLS